MGNSIKVRAFISGSRDGESFKELNEDWIRDTFALEEKDLATLGDPQSTILDRGGRILMMVEGEERIGCVALVPVDAATVELSKMTIARAHRGRGLGRILLERAIEEGRAMGSERLFLGSNTKLADAVHLYEQFGFEHVPPEALPKLPYTRANIFMQLRFNHVAEGRSSSASS